MQLRVYFNGYEIQYDQISLNYKKKFKPKTENISILKKSFNFKQRLLRMVNESSCLCSPSNKLLVDG